ncbi:MAG: helix-turn-helix domain-containing protein [Polyangiaceae bacterium]
MYQLAFPAPALAPFIESYWFVFKTDEVPVELSVDVFVDLRADLVFNFGAPYSRAVHGERPRLIRASNLDAQRIRPIRIEQRGDVLISGVRFKSAGLSPFVTKAVDAWSDQVVPVPAVFGKPGHALEAALRRAGADRAAQTQLFDAFFLERLSLTPAKQTLHTLKTAIEAEGGLERMDELCARTGVPPRQLDRLFRAHLGFPPKAFARVVRFQRALTRLKRDPGCTLAAVAAECGYYDQPHFAREFKALSGTAPSARVGYFPEGAPSDFSPNLVQFTS